ncbi:MAG: HNH nuclease family protein [Candidatus Hydrogenedentes bacterium]|nr:HNH nuclease family protein [Candidatus Hydrogenedentota bacterium]
MRRLRKVTPDPERRKRLMEEVARQREQREKGYREQALRLFPHVCGRCGREFEGAQLRELTVHHKDHNHMNNPPDGSNWELLCVYCHDAEHQDAEQRGHHDSDQVRSKGPTLGHNPFAALKDLLPPKPDEE